MYILGLHPDGNQFRAALLNCQKGKSKIIFTKEFEDPAFLKKSLLKEANYREKQLEVVTALSSDEVFIRNFEFPMSQRKKVLEALPFQIESVLPFSQEGSTLLPQFYARKQSTAVTLYSFRNETLKRHLEELQPIGIDPDLVICVPAALLRFAEVNVAAKNLVVLHLCKDKAYMVTILQGSIVQSLSLRHDHLSRALEPLAKRGDIEGILLTGISKDTPLPLPLLQIDGDPKTLCYAIEIGLALERMKEAKNQLQFRVGSFVAKRQVARLKKRIGTYLALTTLSSLLAFATFFTIFLHKEREMQKRLAYVVALQKEQDDLFQTEPAITLIDTRRENGLFVIRFVSPTEEKAQEFSTSLQVLGKAKLTKDRDGYQITLPFETAP